MSRPYRIAFIDIETAPNLGYTWGRYEQNVIAFTREWYLLSFAVKWAGEKQTKVYCLPDFPGYAKDKTNDRRLVEKLWKVLDGADLVVAHNGDRFDLRKTNARFLVHGMTPPSPYRTVDTLKLARKHFALNSNRLDDVAQLLGLGKKAETGGFDLWLACMAGDRAAWRKMARYNRHDVVLLERVYERLRPWHTSHPNIAIDSAPVGCPACASVRLQRRGFGFSANRKYQQYVCLDCGRWSKGTAAYPGWISSTPAPLTPNFARQKSGSVEKSTPNRRGTDGKKPQSRQSRKQNRRSGTVAGRNRRVDGRRKPRA
jgi:RNase_H superfamily